MNTQAIAQYLNLAEKLILEVRVWARVLWVRIEGKRPRFVSKKVTMNNPIDPFELAEKEQDDRADRADAIAAKINDYLPMGHSVSWNKLHSAAVDVLEGGCTFQEAVERFTSKKIIKKGR